MANTPHLNLPLLSPSQAQKHVTVNDALTLVDLIANLSVLADDLATPPASPAEGDAYIVADAASGDWLGREGDIALYSNGGWLFSTPKAGWKAWNAANEAYSTYSGVSWVRDAAAVSAGGAGIGLSVVELDHVITAGGSNSTALFIPSHSMVIGVTGRVIGPITGSLTSWSLGVAGSDDRYGSGLGLSLDSYAHGLTGTPVTYWADTELLLTADGGAFATGQIRFAVHYLQITPPRAI